MGASPQLAVIWMAYLIGQLGNWLPVPAGSAGPSSGRWECRPLRPARPHRDRGGPALPRDRTVDSRRPRDRRVRAATPAAQARDRRHQTLPAGRHHRDRRARPSDHRWIRRKIDCVADEPGPSKDLRDRGDSRSVGFVAVHPYGDLPADAAVGIRRPEAPVGRSPRRGSRTPWPMRSRAARRARFATSGWTARKLRDRSGRQWCGRSRTGRC